MLITLFANEIFNPQFSLVSKRLSFPSPSVFFFYLFFFFFFFSFLGPGDNESGSYEANSPGN